MVYMFNFGSLPNNYSGGGSDRTPNRQKWFEDLRPLSKQTGPIEDWMREFYPTIVTVDPKECRLLDFVVTDGGRYCISSRTKELIEQLEPNQIGRASGRERVSSPV